MFPSTETCMLCGKTADSVHFWRKSPLEMVYSVCIHCAWDLGVFCRQQHSWHPLGSSQGLKAQEICWEEWRDLWVSHAVQRGWLAERELLFKGIYLTGDQAPRTPVVLEKEVGSCKDDKRHWTFCTECAEGHRLPQVETASSEHLFQAGLFIASPSSVQRKRKGQCSLLESDCYSIFWLSVALCWIENIIIHEKAS